MVVAVFLEDWELGRVALSSHMAMDLLCQEMWDESLGSPSFPVITVPERFSCRTVTGIKAFLSHRGRAVTILERDVARIFELSWLVCILRFCYSLTFWCLPRNEGVPSFRLCASLFCVQFRRSEGGLATFRKRAGHSRKYIFSSFSVCACGRRELSFAQFVSF